MFGVHRKVKKFEDAVLEITIRGCSKSTDPRQGSTVSSVIVVLVKWSLLKSERFVYSFCVNHPLEGRHPGGTAKNFWSGMHHLPSA